MWKRDVNTVIVDQAEDRTRYAGVDALAFHTCESNSEYHAIGVYRVLGELCVRWQHSNFTRRVADNARDLWLDTLYSVEGEQNNAARVAAHWTGLPPVLGSLIDRAAKSATN